MSRKKTKISLLLDKIATSTNREIHDLAIKALTHYVQTGDCKKCSHLVRGVNLSTKKTELINWFYIFGGLKYRKSSGGFKKEKNFKELTTSLSDAECNPFFKKKYSSDSSERLIIKSGEAYIYVMSNKCIKGMLKIGVTDRHPEMRARELSNTSVPDDFIVENSWKCTTESMYELENIIHTRLSNFRYKTNREFFKIELSECVIHIEDELSEHDKRITNRLRLAEKKELGLVASLSDISKMKTRT